MRKLTISQPWGGLREIISELFAIDVKNLVNNQNFSRFIMQNN